MTALTETELTWAKALIALATFALLWWDLKRGHFQSITTKKRVALLVSVAALAAYFQFFRMEYAGYFHRWDVFHYYMGSKYAPELGYERLYFCSALADAESGNRDRVERRLVRDLRDDRLLPAREVLDDPMGCRARFSSPRWRAFVGDVKWFREISGSGPWWDQMQTDHGYNASPVWTAAGHAISSRMSPSVSAFRLLASVDLLLIAGTLGAVFWAFGWRVAALAAVYWGTQAPADLYWTGGAFLRFDWLFWAVLSVALARKQRPLLAGAALAYAGLLRVFPLLLFAGPLVLAAGEIVRRRSLSGATGRFFAGAAIAGVVLVGWGASVSGPRAYRDFYAHLSMHDGTPITNHMSLRTLFVAVPGKDIEQAADPRLLDPLEPWAAARKARLAEMRPFYLAAQALVVALFVYAVWRLRTRWIAMCASLLLVVTLTDPTCYYYLFWILVAPLARARRSLEIALVALAGSGQLLVLQMRPFDLRFVALAALYFSFTLLVVVLFARPPRLARDGA